LYILKKTVFWDVTSCILAEFFWNFGEAASIFRVEAARSHHHVNLKSHTAHPNLLISRHQMGGQNALNSTAGISYNCYVNVILVCCVRTQHSARYRARTLDLLLLFSNISIVPYFRRIYQLSLQY
jgi:hypothetical protein